MKELELKGVWIPKDILLNSELNDKEKIVLSIILTLSTELGYCFASNRYFSKILNVTIGHVSKVINSLEDKGFLTIKLVYAEDSKLIKNRELRLTDKLLKGIVENNHRYSQKELDPIVKNNQDIINKYKKIYRYKLDFEKDKYTNEDLEKLYSN